MLPPFERSSAKDGSGGCAALDDGAAIAIDGGGGDHSIAVDCQYVLGVGAVGIATGAFTTTDEVVGASRSSITPTSETLQPPMSGVGSSRHRS